MPNDKTAPAAPPPTARDGWVRKCDQDDYLDRHLPIPTRIISNEEYDPPAQTPEQRMVERLLLGSGVRGQPCIVAFLRLARNYAQLTPFAGPPSRFGR